MKKHILQENYERYFGKREIGDPLPTFEDVMEKHQVNKLKEDWFDKITVNRNMKDLTGLSSQFKKVATEAQSLQERMSGLYEDMGHILGRYYEINDSSPTDTNEAQKLEADTVHEGTYEDFFQSAMKKFNIGSPDELEDDEKVKFFNYVDKNYSAKSETD